MPQAIGNIQSDNNANFIGASVAGIGLKIGVGLVAGAVDSGAEDAGSIVFKHGARHLAGTGLDEATVENAIKADIQKSVAKATAVGGDFWGKVVVNGQQVFYRAFGLPNGTINVGTYTVGAP